MTDARFRALAGGSLLLLVASTATGFLYFVPDTLGFAVAAPLHLCAFIFFRLHDFRSPQRPGVRLWAVGMAVAATMSGIIIRPEISPASWGGISLGGVLIARFGTEWLARLGRRNLHVAGRGPAARRLRESIAYCPGSPYRLSDDPSVRTINVGPFAANDFPRSARVFEAKDGERFPALETPVEGMSGRVKRTMDVVGAMVALPVVVPVLLLVAAISRIVQGPQVLYRQIRLTDGERPFKIYKLRSMQRDAEAGGQAVWSRRDDPRVTPFGRLLRRSWIDELPQIFNVLRGDLSLVGPRPERPEFVQEFTQILSNYQDRHRTRAGMTGWAQVHGFVGSTSIHKRVRLDRTYVRRWTPMLDVCVVVMTLCHFIRRKRPPSRELPSIAG